jgi:hypothetical protein
LAQLMELGAELLGTATKQTKKARDRSEDFVSYIQDQVTAGSRSFGKKIGRLRTKPSAKTRSLQFVAGFGVGVGGALFLAPLSGKQMRDKLLNATRWSVDSSPQ